LTVGKGPLPPYPGQLFSGFHFRVDVPLPPPPPPPSFLPLRPFPRVPCTAVLPASGAGRGVFFLDFLFISCQTYANFDSVLLRIGPSRALPTTGVHELFFPAPPSSPAHPFSPLTSLFLRTLIGALNPRPHPPILSPDLCFIHFPSLDWLSSYFLPTPLFLAHEYKNASSSVLTRQLTPPPVPKPWYQPAPFFLPFPLLSLIWSVTFVPSFVCSIKLLPIHFLFMCPLPWSSFFICRLLYSTVTSLFDC